MRHSQTISSLSLSLFFLPSAQTAKRRRRREKEEEEEISRKKRCLDDEEEQRLRPVAFGWCER
jgi:Zn-dependent M16 (insulinase) family peptidase